MILAIDPGPKESALVWWDGEHVIDSMFLDNYRVRTELRMQPHAPDILAIEHVVSFGMAVGAEVFETVLWCGRFVELWIAHCSPGASPEVRKINRREIKLHICGSPRAKDPNIRRALIDRFGKQGTKKNPGPLYGISSHKWAALAVAVTCADMENKKP